MVILKFPKFEVLLFLEFITPSLMDFWFKSFEPKKKNVVALENNFPTMYHNSNQKWFDHFVEHFKGWE
jgi:hypothetical protein